MQVRQNWTIAISNGFPTYFKIAATIFSTWCFPEKLAMENILVPEQVVGRSMDVRSESVLHSQKVAILFYQLVKLRLADISNWHLVCGTSATTFQLTFPDGSPCFRLEVGNLIKIDIPGPGTGAGEGYDWVRIERIEDNGISGMEEWMGFTVRPCPSPFNPEAGTAHFFSDQASSTFIVGRDQDIVWAEMHGRNELPNTKLDGVFDSLRNTMVGWSAKVGLAYPQWKLLTDGLVRPNYQDVHSEQ